MLIPSYVLEVCHKPIQTLNQHGLPILIPDPNNPGKETYEYSWQRGTKVSHNFEHFNQMGDRSFYMSINSVTIADYPIRPFNAQAVNNCFHVKSNWTGDVVLQTFDVARAPVKQQMQMANFGETEIIHLVTNPRQNLELEIIPVFPARVDGMNPRDERPQIPYIFPTLYVDYSQIRLNIVVHLYKTRE